MTENGYYSHFLKIFFGRLLFILKLGRLLAESNITLLFHPLIQNRKCFNLTRQPICVLTHYPHQRKEKQHTILASTPLIITKKRLLNILKVKSLEIDYKIWPLKCHSNVVILYGVLCGSIS